MELGAKIRQLRTERSLSQEGRWHTRLAFHARQ